MTAVGLVERDLRPAPHHRNRPQRYATDKPRAVPGCSTRATRRINPEDSSTDWMIVQWQVRADLQSSIPALLKSRKVLEMVRWCVAKT